MRKMSFLRFGLEVIFFMFKHCIILLFQNLELKIKSEYCKARELYQQSSIINV